MKYIYTEIITKEFDIPQQIEWKIKELYNEEDNHDKIIEYLLDMEWDYLFGRYRCGELINNNLIE
jgi:hypothetical protein